MELLHTLQSKLTHRYNFLKTNPIFKAATIVVEPRNWPFADPSFDSFGNEAIDTLYCHFESVLQKNSPVPKASFHLQWSGAKLLAKSRPTSALSSFWKDLFMDKEHQHEFKELLKIMEIVLVLPLSNAICERGFSTMKRVKTCLRSSMDVSMLDRLMLIAIEGESVQDFDPTDYINFWLTTGKGHHHIAPLTN